MYKNISSLIFKQIYRKMFTRPLHSRFHSFNHVCVCQDVHLCAADACRGLKKGIRFPGAGVIGGSELCSSDAGNQTRVLYKSSTCL